MALRHLRGLASAVTLLATAVLAGCGGSDTTDPEPTPDISGLYLLRTLNGTPLPFEVVTRPGLEPSTAEFTWAGLFLTDNGTDGGVYRVEWIGHWVGQAQSQTQVITGTYVRFGVDDIAFRGDSATTYPPVLGKIVGRRITGTEFGLPIMLASGRNTQVQLSSPIVEGPPFTYVWEK